MAKPNYKPAQPGQAGAANPGVGASNPQQGGSANNMSSTAGPISAAMGAGNFTQGLQGVKPPNFGQLQPGQLNNPTSMFNYTTGYQNQANNANNQRYNQALGVMGQAQGSTNSLFGAAQQDVQGIGDQAMQRINLQQQNALGSVQQDATNRGLGNTTIANTMQYMPLRQAEDARQGVNEMQARLQSGLLTQQAGTQQQYGNEIAGLIGSRNDTGPDVGQFAALAQGSAAGNYGQKPPMRTGSTTQYPAPAQKSAPSMQPTDYQNQMDVYNRTNNANAGPRPPAPNQGGYSQNGSQDSNFSPAMAKAGYGGGTSIVSALSGGMTDEELQRMMQGQSGYNPDSSGGDWGDD